MNTISFLTISYLIHITVNCMTFNLPRVLLLIDREFPVPPEVVVYKQMETSV